MSSRSEEDSENADPPGQDSSETDDSGIDPARVYFNGIARSLFLGRQAEVALAKRIEDSEHLMLAALVEVPALQGELIRARAQLPADTEDEPGTPVTRKQPRALMAPPGIPEFLSRVRHVPAGRTRIEGRAWSGGNAVERVEFSADGGRTWEDAQLGESNGRHGWTGWAYEWEPAGPGDYELCVRATDAAGNVQPLDSSEAWNQGGYGVNAVQRVPVRVT